MSDSEADEKSYSYDNNSDDDFKEDFDDKEYDEPSVKPRIKIGPIIDDVADDQEEMEYAGMDSDDEDVYLETWMHLLILRLLH